MSTAAPTNPGPAGYDVARPHGQCGMCNAAIEPEIKYMAALRETPTGLQRLDCCMACWDSCDRQGLLGFWKTAMPRTQQKKKLFVDDEVLCGLFERLGQTSETNKINFRFVLGLVLMRKRMLVYESTRRDAAGEFWSLRFRGRQEKLEMLNPRLTEEQVQEVSRQIGEILNEEL